MAIQNRDVSLAQQRETLQFSPKSATFVVTGTSYTLGIVSHPCALQAGFVSAYGLSGSPIFMIQAHRWLGTGFTLIDLGISGIVVAGAPGLSGAAQGWSGIRTLGSSLLLLQAGDTLKVTTSGANTAAAEVAIALVVQKTQDIVQDFGLQT